MRSRDMNPPPWPYELNEIELLGNDGKTVAFWFWFPVVHLVGAYRLRLANLPVPGSDQ